MAIREQQVYPYPAPLGGLRYDKPSSGIESFYMPDCRNVRLVDGCVVKRPGDQRLGSNLPLSGSVIGSDLFRRFSGSQSLIVATEADLWILNPTSKMWETITPSVEADGCESGWNAGSGDTVTHSATCVRGSYSMKCVLAAQRVDGNLLAYKNVSSTDLSGQTSIGFWVRSSVSLPANALEVVVSETLHASGEKTGTYTECLSTAISADTWTFVRVSKTLSSFNAVVSVSLWANTTLAAATELYLDDVRGYIALSGSDANYLSSDSVLKSTEVDLWWVATNGIDAPLKWTGSGVASALITDKGGLTTLTATSLVRYKDYAILLGTVENGNAYPGRVRWPNTGDPTDFGTGNASYWDSPGSDGISVGFVYKNDYLLVAKERSLWVGYASGDTDIMSFSCVSPSIGCPAGRTLRGLEDAAVVFLGCNAESNVLDVYAFDGSVPVSIGGQIRRELNRTINRSQLSRCHARIIHDQKEYWLYVPGTDSDYPDQIWIYNYELKAWTRGDTSRSTQATGYWEQTADLSWNDLVGTWDEQTLRWSDATLGSSSPITLIGDVDGYVYQISESLRSEDTGVGDVAIDAWFATPELSLGKLVSRWQLTRIDQYHSGGDSSVEYSTDKGASWTNLATLTGHAASSLSTMYCKLDVSSVMLRWRNNTAGSDMVWQEARLYWSPSGGRLA